MDTICVSNMPDHYNEVIVNDIFSRYGKVIGIERTKNEPYVWHIKYNTVNAAQHAFSVLSPGKLGKIDKKIMSNTFSDAWNTIVTMMK